MGGGSEAVNDIKITTRNAGLVKDVMRDLPGVYVGGTNGMNQKIYMRGVSDRGLNITIDGAKQNGNTFHHNADLLIDTDLIKSVDMEVGAKSVVNGSGALGGSVAFKTVDASDLLEYDEKFGAKIRTGYATNNKEFQKSIMLFAAPLQGLDFLAALNHKNYDFGKSGGKGYKIGGDGNDLSYLFKLGYSFLDAHRISLSHEKMQYKGDYGVRAEFRPTDDNGVSKREYKRETATLKYEYSPSDLLNLDFTTYSTTHQRIDTSKCGVETNGLNIKAKTKLEGTDIKHTFRYEIDYYQSENFNKPTGKTKALTMLSGGTLSPSNLRPEKVKNYAIYLEDAIKI